MHIFSKKMSLALMVALAPLAMHPHQTDQQSEEQAPTIDALFEGLDSDDDALDSVALDILASLEDHRVSAVSCDPQTLVDSLVKFKVPQLLSRNFYRHTNPPTTQSLLDNGILQPHLNKETCWSVDMTAFYNQTSKMYFTQCSPFVDSYLDFPAADFIDEIEILGLETLNIPDVLELFRPIKLQERRFGMMFAGGMRLQKWFFSTTTPLYYFERNFFLTQKEADAISNAPLFTNNATGSDEDEVMAFMLKHLVSDKVGFGDTRLTSVYSVYDGCYGTVWLGAQATIPTAIALKNGILGGTFCKQFIRPPFDLQKILSLYLCTQDDDITSKNDATDVLTNLGIQTLDALTANVADQSLGNGGHFGVAPYFEYAFKLTPNLTLAGYAAVEYLFASTQRRYFIIKKNPASVTDRNYTDPSLAAENLQFLSTVAVNMLLPQVIDVSVRPGFLTRALTSLNLDLDWIRGSIGYDFWWQQQEHIYPCSNGFVLDYSKGIKSSASMHKLFALLDFQFPCVSYDLRIGLRGAATVASQGVGKDFTIAVSASLSF